MSADPQTAVDDAGATRGGLLPRLDPLEWITFCLLAALISIINIYTTIVIGWGDTGSIIAVVAAMLVLTKVFRRKPSVHSLNLGQTLASAGGAVGFSVANYAALKLVDPTFDPGTLELTILFAGLAVTGTVIGSFVRKQMVKYFFPSGTACAVIQKTVTAEGEDAKRPARLLAIWGGLAALATIPAKISFAKGSKAILYKVSISNTVGFMADPLLLGIGVVIGPRVGLGILIGGLVGGFVIPGQLQQWGLTDPSLIRLWSNWAGISLLTVPTFVAIALGYYFRTKHVVPGGFPLGKIEYQTPTSKRYLLLVLGGLGMATVLYGAHAAFDMPWYIAALVAVVAIPLCIVNGRVTGETDINPVRLVAIALISLFVIFATVHTGSKALFLVACAIVGGTLASIAVDMMQDFRTGYLVNANHHHQTSVQFIGSLIGALAAVPFIFFFEDAMAPAGKSTAFFTESALQMPGARVWADFATAVSGQQPFMIEMVYMIIGLVVVGSIYAYFTANPKTSKYMPSLFGIGIGLILHPLYCNTIFLGALIRWIYIRAKAQSELPTPADFELVTDPASGVYSGGQTLTLPEKMVAATLRARQRVTLSLSGDMLLVGSAIFAASGLISIALIALTQLMEWQGIELFFFAG